MNHIPFETLVDYTENQLNQNQSEAVVAHLKTCAVCQAELERVHSILSDMGDHTWTAPANHLINRVLSAFRRRASQQSQRTTHPINLALDSWTQLAALGLRGSPKERQFLFSEDAFDLDIQVVKEADTQNYALQGQLFSNDGQDSNMEGFEVQITGPSDFERRGLTDYLGRFSFLGLEASTYTLKLILNDRDLLVESLPIHPTPSEN